MREHGQYIEPPDNLVYGRRTLPRFGTSAMDVRLRNPRPMPAMSRMRNYPPETRRASGQVLRSRAGQTTPLGVLELRIRTELGMETTWTLGQVSSCLSGSHGPLLRLCAMAFNSSFA